MKIWWQLLTYIHHYLIHKYLYLIHFITGHTAVWLDTVLQHHTCTRFKQCLLHPSIYQTTHPLSNPFSSSSPSSFTLLPPFPWLTTTLSTLWVSKQIPYSRKLLRKKTFMMLWKFWGCNIFWWHKWPICKSFFHENLLTSSQKFSVSRNIVAITYHKLLGLITSFPSLSLLNSPSPPEFFFNK